MSCLLCLPVATNAVEPRVMARPRENPSNVADPGPLSFRLRERDRGRWRRGCEGGVRRVLLLLLLLRAAAVQRHTCVR